MLALFAQVILAVLKPDDPPCTNTRGYIAPDATMPTAGGLQK
jgi:hypothetical protein